jgi:MOSC domain-containing protein YiiM
MNGNIVSIHIADAPGRPLHIVPEARAVAGRGIEGDRHFRAEGDAGTGANDQQITLVESETLEALRRDYGLQLSGADTRRNVLTRGIALNHLVGREFRAGETMLRGLGLCEPCGHLEKLTRSGVRKGLIHRGGLRAEIVRGGTLRAGDPIEEIEAP